MIDAEPTVRCESEVVVKKHKKDKKRKHDADIEQASASDFLKTPDVEVILTTKQLEKQERKRQRQVRRLAKEIDAGLQISD